MDSKGITYTIPAYLCAPRPPTTLSQPSKSNTRWKSTSSAKRCASSMRPRHRGFALTSTQATAPSTPSR
eukprot:2797800-Prymnesium_polylepis.1